MPTVVHSGRFDSNLVEVSVGSCLGRRCEKRRVMCRLQKTKCRVEFCWTGRRGICIRASKCPKTDPCGQPAFDFY